MRTKKGLQDKRYAQIQKLHSECVDMWIARIAANIDEIIKRNGR